MPSQPRRGRLTPNPSRQNHQAARFDRQAIEELKSFVDPLTLPSDDEFPPQIAKYFAGVGRSEVQGRIGRLFRQGLQKPGPVEEKLGSFAARA